MSGFLITAKNKAGKVLAKFTEFPVDRPDIWMSLVDMEEEGRAECIVNKGGYPYIYAAKARDIIPLIENWFDGLPEWDSRRKEDVWMTGDGVGVFAPQSRSIKNAAIAAETEVSVFAQQSRSIKSAAIAAGTNVTRDMPLKTAENKAEIPAYSPDETLEIELWDIS